MVHGAHLGSERFNSVMYICHAAEAYRQVHKPSNPLQQEEYTTNNITIICIRSQKQDSFTMNKIMSCVEKIRIAKTYLLHTSKDRFTDLQAELIESYTQF